jgi:hypothetical protein
VKSLEAGLETKSPEQPLTTLRGASVAVDARVVGRVVLGVCVVGLAVLAVVLFVAGAHKNAQINGLKQHGVPVTDTVSACSGLLGGSGSNAAGYRCWGTFTIDGHSYSEDIPGNVLRAPGSKIQVIADPEVPGLMTTPSVLAGEHASSGVFILPAVLVAILVVLVGALALRRRSTRSLPVLGLGSDGPAR